MAKVQTKHQLRLISLAFFLAISSCTAKQAVNTGSEESVDNTTETANDAAEANAAGSELAPFSWPVPRPSTRMSIARDIVLTRGPTLKDVADTIEGDLAQAGYHETGYFRVPDGFAVATPMERFHSGTGKPFPESERFKVDAEGLINLSNGFTFAALKNALLHADPGNYRVILFVVTDKVISISKTGMTSDQGIKLNGEGSPDLPTDFKSPRYNDHYTTTALIYEFARPSVGKDATMSIPSSLPAITHLREAGILK